MPQTDEQLVELSLHGNTEAFETLLSRHLTSVFNFVYRLIGNQDDAHDVTQDVFFKVWKNLRTFDMKLSFKAWMFGIARNASIDWLRKKKPLTFSRFDTEEHSNVIEDTLSDTAPLASQLYESKEAGKLLEKALESISPEHRAILTMKHAEELTFEEIALIVGKPMNTVKSQYRRALIGLRKTLENAPKQP